MKNNNKVSGYVVYEGASMLTGEPIVGIITMKSVNKKTGDFPQLWIVRSDVSPNEASKQGIDGAICGNCPLRRSLGGACYVNLGHGPRAVYASYKKGNYPCLEDYNVLEGKMIRFGAYGDPAALPLDILLKLKAVASNNTSYTHQWKRFVDSDLKNVSMASVDNLDEAQLAKENGWRWFRVSADGKDLRDDEILCPNVTHGISCKDCKLCSGMTLKGAKSIVIPVHGSLTKRYHENLDGSN